MSGNCLQPFTLLPQVQSTHLVGTMWAMISLRLRPDPRGCGSAAIIIACYYYCYLVILYKAAMWWKAQYSKVSSFCNEKQIPMLKSWSTSAFERPWIIKLNYYDIKRPKRMAVLDFSKCTIIKKLYKMLNLIAKPVCEVHIRHVINN